MKKSNFHRLALGLVLSMFLALFSLKTNISYASNDCSYVGSSHGCDTYDCGNCMMWACGPSGGMLVCNDVEAQD